MLFNSIEFLIFLPLVFFGYWFAFKSLRWQNLFVVAVSYLFYGWWDWRFLLLILFTSLCSYLSGVYLEKCAGNRSVQKWISAGNILLNLSILGVFKYFDFFTENLVNVLHLLGWDADYVTLNILLPVGISFYTFQALSYTIDVYQGKIKATHDIVAFFAYISFFPQLVAGPIERATHLLPQFLRPRNFDCDLALDGIRQMLWGFFKKVVVADNCALFVNGVFENYHTHFVTLLKHWKQMKWFVKLWVIISIQTSLMRNVWNGQAMLPLFHNGKLITTWTFIKELNLKIRLCLVFFFF